MPAAQESESGASGAPGAAMAATVGMRIRNVRDARGISLASLAASTGLGKGTLSELERGLRNPTLDTLFSISTCLNLPLSELLVEREASNAETAASRASGQSVDALLVSRWNDAETLVEVYRVTISQETRRSQPHVDGVVETLTLVSGTVEVGVEGETVRLGPGESHHFQGDRAHVYRGAAPVSEALLIMQYPFTAPTRSGAAPALT